MQPAYLNEFVIIQILTALFDFPCQNQMPHFVDNAGRWVNVSKGDHFFCGKARFLPEFPMSGVFPRFVWQLIQFACRNIQRNLRNGMSVLPNHSTAILIILCQHSYAAGVMQVHSADF